MKVKFGAIVTDGRGKIGGHVLSKNRAGAYMRTKVTPVNPQTSYQADVRALFSSLTQGWRSLTAPQRLAWDNAVSNFATTDIFGDLRNPTGKNLYQRLNTNISNAGGTLITSPPLPAGGGETPDITPSFTVAGGVISLAFAASPIPAGFAVIIEMTPPMSPSVSFVKNEFRILGVLPPADATPTVFTTQYAARFGAFALGQQIWVRARMVNLTTGETGGFKKSTADSM